jgi:4-hydroxy-tetrahydrodipicolinate synthase
MSPEEQGRALEIVIDENGGRLPVIAGCGGSGTRMVAGLAAQAARLGADGVLLSAPPYNRPPQRALVEHFLAVIDAADLPAILYNVPSRAAVNILPATVMRVAEDARVIGLKEASGDITQVAEIARIGGDRLALWSGNDDQVVALMALGGRGVISVIANVVPGPVRRMAHAFLDGDIAESRRLQLELLPLTAAIFAESNPIPVKAAVGWLGFAAGEPRAPLTSVDEAIFQRVIGALRALGVGPRG